MHVKVSDNIIIVGTAHVSEDSVNEVRSVIDEYKPDIVAVELCERRYKGLTEKDQWENTPVTKLLEGNNAYFMLAQTFLSSIQRKLGKEQGVEPGSEMIAAMDEAKEHDLTIELADRDISVTLRRAWKKMGFREKFRLIWEFLKATIGYEEEDLEELNLEELMDQDVISAMMEEFGRIAPSVTQVLIYERDTYIAKKIYEASKKGRVVAVVGAGHLKGIQKHLAENTLDDVDLSELEYVPEKRLSVAKIVGYLIPILFVGIILYILFINGWQEAADALLWWILINGSLSALGTALARAHPLTIGTAFLAAPITSLNPTIAAGWIAGWVEYKLRKPVIKDFKDLRNIESTGDLLKNRVVRLLLVVAFANLGSSIGTFIALPYLLRFI